jgi:hypothetical protein
MKSNPSRFTKAKDAPFAIIPDIRAELGCMK